MNAKRRKQLVGQLALAAQVACESHRAKQQATLERMLGMLIELLPSQKMNDARRKSLADILLNSAFGEIPTVTIDKDYKRHLYITGHFDVGELAKHMTWGSVVPENEPDTVGGEDDTA